MKNEVSAGVKVVVRVEVGVEEVKVEVRVDVGWGEG